MPSGRVFRAACLAQVFRMTGPGPYPPPANQACSGGSGGFPPGSRRRVPPPLVSRSSLFLSFSFPPSAALSLAPVLADPPYPAAVVCASSMVCAGGVCQLCAAARSRRLLIKQAVLPPNPDQTTRARCCRLVLGAYLANFSGFFFALFFFSRPLLLDTPKADKAMRLGVLESGYPT